ncbi:hybrid sensor histidine kinase/response regulator [Pelagicoccus albus]|uniref:histidine kinase n=1 Tax=Pelagicoccus albus TaxID=415222 RepID=A0A7X1E8G2_9BACT|nr:hybrid sensor histidine kinase/response regulator [Pelagicoccus albus]MBC2606231.1 response regulator [Pelagicoccus albus]
MSSISSSADKWLENNLSKLPRISADLFEQTDTDSVFRVAVELGRTLLGFERIGIWLVEQDSGRLRGTYGVNDEGEVVDERDKRLFDYARFVEAMSEACEDSKHYYDNAFGELRSSDSKILGKGRHISAPLFSDGKVIGFVAVDDLIPCESVNDRTGMLLCQFAQMVSNAYLACQRSVEVDRLKAELNRRDQEQAEFLGMIGHEVRTPLNAIMGFAQLLRMRDESSEINDIANTIEGCGGHLVGLVDSFVMYSHLSGGESGSCSSPGDVVDVLSETVRGFRAQYSCKGLTLDFDHHGPKLTSEFDAVALRQILTNLLNNAYKFTNQGGVRVKVLSRSLNAGQTEFLIEVIDSGIGLAEDQNELIFRPFHQIIKRSEKNAGIGMGLAIVKRLVTQMGGQISCRSSLGQGSTFSVSLRFADSDQTFQAPKEAGTEKAQYGSRILIVEDDETNLEVLSSMTACLGFMNTDVALDGEQACSMLRDRPYDLVLMDVQMPKLDGISLTRLVRGSGSCLINRDVPIVGVTAYTIEHDRAECLAAGMNDYITKPIMIDRLKEALNLA